VEKPATARIDVSVDTVAARDRGLSLAVEDLLPVAFDHRQGILVTRHNVYKYSVEVTPAVPCGLIQEKRH
jgi:hypothetical protein